MASIVQHPTRGNVASGSKTDRKENRDGARPDTSLLTTPMHQGAQQAPGTRREVDRTNSCWTVQFVRGYAHAVGTKVPYVHWDLSARLSSIDVEQGIGTCHGVRDRGDWLNGPDFVVGVHDRSQHHLTIHALADGFCYGGRLDTAKPIHRHNGELDILFLQCSADFEHTFMLDGAGHKGATAASKQSLQDQVV